MPRKQVPKSRNGGKWTEARFRQFVIGNLRKASLKWGQMHKAVERATVGRRKNAKTGRICITVRCECCNKTLPRYEAKVDHIEPVVPVTGFTTYDDFINRLFCEADNFQVLCPDCHQIKSNEENVERREIKRNSK